MSNTPDLRKQARTMQRGPINLGKHRNDNYGKAFKFFKTIIPIFMGLILFMILYHLNQTSNLFGYDEHLSKMLLLGGVMLIAFAILGGALGIYFLVADMRQQNDGE